MLKTRIIAVFLLIIATSIGLITFYVGNFKLGLDLNGGTHLVYKADISKIARSEVKVSMEALRDVIEKRVNMFGVGEPIVQVEQAGILGSSEASQKLIVELPGVTDIDEAKKTTVSLFDVTMAKGGKRPVVVVILRSDDREGDAVKIINFLKKNAYFSVAN